MLGTKDASGPATISLCILEGSPDACRVEKIAADSIWWSYLPFIEVSISGNSRDFVTVIWKWYQASCFFMCPDITLLVQDAIICCSRLVCSLEDPSGDI